MTLEVNGIYRRKNEITNKFEYIRIDSIGAKTVAGEVIPGRKARRAVPTYNITVLEPTPVGLAVTGHTEKSANLAPDLWERIYLY